MGHTPYCTREDVAAGDGVLAGLELGLGNQSRGQSGGEEEGKGEESGHGWLLGGGVDLV